jgi:hypothetical protein
MCCKSLLQSDINLLTAPCNPWFVSIWLSVWALSGDRLQIWNVHWSLPESNLRYRALLAMRLFHVKVGFCNVLLQFCMCMLDVRAGFRNVRLLCCMCMLDLLVLSAGYIACASYDLEEWFRVPTSWDPEAGVITITHTPKFVSFPWSFRFGQVCFDFDANQT